MGGLRRPVGHGVVVGDPAAYSAHPHMAVAADGTWLAVFTQAPRRPIVLHPPLDPEFRNMLIRSSDEGQSWSRPEPVPDGVTTGLECAGLTALADGSVLLNQWQFGWMAPESLTEGDRSDDLFRPEALCRQWAGSQEFVGLHGTPNAAVAAPFITKARKGGRCLVSLAEHGRASFRPVAEIDTKPFSGGYGMRGAAVLPDGSIVLPLSDVPHYRTVFVVRSNDGGRTWGAPVVAASLPGCSFEEPAPLHLGGGRILMILRENEGRAMYEVRSFDGGRTWSLPRPIGIADYPAQLLRLKDGRVAMVAGRRRPPFGITLYLSSNEGVDWAQPIALRDDLPDRDLGYPAMAQRSNGDLVVLYYGRDASGTTAILSTTVPAEAIEQGDDDIGPG